ncbi:hypothetical protein AnigIFM63604_006499 [Aspergillus niger]|uniref:Uncharacterized protein n=1 Tax=Aspergillus niger TaxID=5061 RepID=A0A9W6E971_ASPNG|nr:hypothetical protein AnigIFM63604_006499 [Aspergillus niger]
MRVTEKGVSAKNANQVEVPEKNILTKDTEQDEEQNIWRLNKNSDFPDSSSQAQYFKGPENI